MLGVTFFVTNPRGFFNRLGVLEIRNDGTGNFERASYDVVYIDEENMKTTKARIEDYKRADGPLTLVKLAIECIEGQNAASILPVVEMISVVGLDDKDAN